MDRLDRIGIIAIVALLATSAVLVRSPGEEAPVITRNTASPATRDRFSRPDDLQRRAGEIRALMENGALDTARVQAIALCRNHPNDGALHMLLGDIHLRAQRLSSALEEYKTAVDRHPDYLDKKTRDYQGKKIKHAVNEALAIIERKSTDHPEAARLRSNRKLLYYLLRRIAGSCG